MEKTLQEKNKALVLEAFDTLFNKRDCVAAEHYWSPDYIQHSAHIEPELSCEFEIVCGWLLLVWFPDRSVCFTRRRSTGIGAPHRRDFPAILRRSVLEE